MRKDYGEFALTWHKEVGHVEVKYEVYNDHEGETFPATDMPTLFEFLSSMGITKQQCIKAFDDEDQA
jgi:hypothetical protein